MCAFFQFPGYFSYFSTPVADTNRYLECTMLSEMKRGLSLFTFIIRFWQVGMLLGASTCRELIPQKIDKLHLPTFFETMLLHARLFFFFTFTSCQEDAIGRYSRTKENINTTSVAVFAGNLFCISLIWSNLQFRGFVDSADSIFFSLKSFWSTEITFCGFSKQSLTIHLSL